MFCLQYVMYALLRLKILARIVHSYTTTLSGARVMVSGIEALIERNLTVRSLQDYRKGICPEISPIPEAAKEANSTQ